MELHPLQSNNPLEPKKNWFLRHEVLYSVIGVLLVVLVVGSVYLYKAENPCRDTMELSIDCAAKMEADLKSDNSAAPKTTPDTSTWKTSTNSQYGFEFKYPKEWEFFQDSKNSEIDLNLPYILVSMPNNLFEVTIDSQTHSADPAGVEAYAKNKEKGHFCTDKECAENYVFFDLKESKKITLGGMDGWLRSYYDPEDKTYDNLYYFSQNGKIFILEQSPKSDITDQILSTFKFTDSTSAVDTSTWKTYTDTNNGFSFQYPEGAVVTILKSGETTVNGGNNFQFSVYLSDRIIEKTFICPPTGETVTLKQEKISGRTWYHNDDCKDGGGNSGVYWETQVGTKALSLGVSGITNWTDTDEDAKYINHADIKMIAGTFKFTK